MTTMSILTVVLFFSHRTVSTAIMAHTYQQIQSKINYLNFRDRFSDKIIVQL